MEGGSTYADVGLGGASANEAWNLSPTVDVDSSPRLCELWVCRAVGGVHNGFVLGMRVDAPNDQKLSDTTERRGTCTVGGKTAVEAGVVTRRRVRCSAWLGDVD